MKLIANIRTFGLGLTGCTICLLPLVAIICLLGLCFDYTLVSCFDQDVPFLLDCLAGTFTSAMTVPAAIVCLVLNYCGAPTPYFDF